MIASRIRLRNFFTEIALTKSIEFNDATVVSTRNSPNISFDMRNSDLTQMTLDQICSAQLSCYIVLQEGAFRDMAGNNLTATPSSDATAFPQVVNGFPA